MLPQLQRRSRRATLALGPNEFARAIAVEKRRWRKDLSGLPGHAIRRRVRHLARRLSGAFLRLNPGVSIPSAAAMGFALQSAWDVPNAEDIKVVILPRGAPGDVSGVDLGEGEGAGGAATGTVRPNPRSERKELKALLRSLTTEYRRTRFELTYGRRARARARYGPQVGTLSIGGSRTERALYLEALGAVICTGLSEGDADCLRGQGARVIDNVPMALVDTPNEGKPKSPGSRTPSAEDLWHRDRVGAKGMYAKGCSGKGVTIGLLDTGIDAGHPEFAGKQIWFAAFGKDGGHLPDVRAKDFHKHGTSVGSVCAGRKVGIAPDADIAVAAVLTERDGAGNPVGYVAQVLRGLNWLVEGGFGLPAPVDLINASLGLYVMRGPEREDFSNAVETYRVRDGMLMVAAIGNHGRKGIGNHAIPGNFATVLGVGAVDRDNAVAPFSSWGAFEATVDNPAFDKPDLSAPGVAIVSAIPRPKYGKAGPLYEESDGTSVASPIVAGCAALLLQADNSLRRQPDDLCDTLMSLTTRSTGWDDPVVRSRCGKGVLDLRPFSDKMGHSDRNG